MWLEAVLTEDDVRAVARQFSPLEIRLGTDGRLALSRPLSVSLVPGRGVEVVCNGQLDWPVLGMHVPVAMEKLTAMVVPALAPSGRDGEHALVLRLAIERAGVSHLGFVDERITALLNDELARHHTELTWNFARVLTHTFSLPASLLSAETVSLEVRSGEIKVTRKGMALAVQMGSSVRRRVGSARDLTRDLLTDRR